MTLVSALGPIAAWAALPMAALAMPAATTVAALAS